MKTPLKVIGVNHCDSCKACCHVFSIDELKKPDRTDCEHLINNQGDGCCGIYDTRPNMCRLFKCNWLNGMVMKGRLAYRPDKLGLIFTTLETPPLIGMLGVFKVKKYEKLSGRARGLMRDLEQTQLYFFEERIYGPQKLIDTWKAQFVKSKEGDT